MKIYNPSVELWENKDSIAHVARCARVCYGKDTGKDDYTIAHLKACEHYSMFRHDTKYVILRKFKGNVAWELALKYLDICKNNTVAGIDIISTDKVYIVVNGQWVLEHKEEWNYWQEFEVTPEEFQQTEIGFNMMRYTFCCITQISTSRELNRVSPNNIAEQSTRYVYEDGSIVKPWWLNEYNEFKYNSEVYGNTIVQQYINACEGNFNDYKIMINNGMNKQDARGILPLDTRTKVIYTYSIDEWRDIIDLRYYGITGKPHENAKIIAGMIREQLIDLGYNFK